MSDAAGTLGLAARARKTATGESVYTQLRARHVHRCVYETGTAQLAVDDLLSFG